MKTSVVQNVLLGLIVIENNIHEYIIYNKKADGFVTQVDKFVTSVQTMI